MFIKLSAPISVQWELTPWCTHRCVHCYNYWRNDTNALLLPDEPRVFSPKQIAEELIAHKIFHITLTGGEPLAVIRRYAPAVTLLRDAGITLSINSNLALLDPERLNLLRQLKIRSVLTSLMAADESLNDELAGHRGAFRKTLKGIKSTIAAGLQVSINMVVTKKNAAQVRTVGALAKQIGAMAFCATKATKPPACVDFSPYAIDHLGLKQMFADLLWVRDTLGLSVDSLEHYPACAFPSEEARNAFGGRNCSAGKSGCTIGFDGNIRPCSHAHVTYGKIADGFSSAWDAMDEWRQAKLVPEGCKTECPEYPHRCGGGCRMEAFSHTGNLAAEDPFCARRSPIPHKSSAIDGIHLEANGRCVPSSHLVFRAETFGFIAYRSPKNWLAIDDILYHFLCESRDRGGFTAADLAHAYGVPEPRALPTLRLLVSKKMVNVGAKNSNGKEEKNHAPNWNHRSEPGGR